MSKFNTKDVHSHKTVTYEGGKAYTKTLEDEWTSMLFSTLLQDRFYENSEIQQKRFIDLTDKMIEKRGPEFVGKAAVFSRNVLGMRSISELTAGILNRHSFDGKRQFYANYFRRPDGIGEVFSVIDMFGDKRSHALVRGAADYLASQSAYTIGKYPMRDHKYTMYDIINICHPKSQVIDLYQRHHLKHSDTWESKIHNTHGIERENEWKRLVEEKKLGYLALLRNLRNILNCDSLSLSWVKENVCPQIENKEAIEKSLIWPYQIYTAYKAVENDLPLCVTVSLSNAFEIATANMPELNGKNLVVLDVSGSMDSRMSKNNKLTIKEVCAVYAAAIYAATGNCDFIKFGSYAKKMALNKKKHIFALISDMAKNDGCDYGTNINTVFEILDQHYDRIFLFSDMQVMREDHYWCQDKSAQMCFTEYQERYGKTKMYSFDLGNYPSQLVSSRKELVFITALNDTVFKAIEMLEDPEKSLIDLIEEYQC